MICRILLATEALFDKRIVVTRHETVARLCREKGVDVVLHGEPHRSDTIRLGLEAVGNVDACLFCPADQPLLRRETICALLESWKNDRQFIWRPICDNSAGAPVLFPRWAFEQLKNLPQSKGGGWVIQQHPQQVAPLKIEDPFELMDADTPQTLDLLLQHHLMNRSMT